VSLETNLQTVPYTAEQVRSAVEAVTTSPSTDHVGPDSPLSLACRQLLTVLQTSEDARRAAAQYGAIEAVRQVLVSGERLFASAQTRDQAAAILMDAVGCGVLLVVDCAENHMEQLVSLVPAVTAIVAALDDAQTQLTRNCLELLHCVAIHHSREVLQHKGMELAVAAAKKQDPHVVGVAVALLASLLHVRDPSVSLRFWDELNGGQIAEAIIRSGSASQSVGGDGGGACVSSAYGLPYGDVRRTVLEDTLWAMRFCAESSLHCCGRVMMSEALPVITTMLGQWPSAPAFVRPPSPTQSDVAPAADPLVAGTAGGTDLILPFLRILSTATAGLVELWDGIRPARPPDDGVQQMGQPSLPPDLNVDALASLEPSQQLAVQRWTEQMVDRVCALPNALALLQSLLSHPHRGVVSNTIFLIGSIACGSVQHLRWAAHCLPAILELLHRGASFDIKRDAVFALHRLVVSHDGLLHKDTMETHPALIDELLDVFNTCRFDAHTLHCAMSFLEDLLQLCPRLKRTLMQKNVIEVLEQVETHEDESLHRHCQRITDKYFWDEEEDDDDAEQHMEEEHRLQQQMRAPAAQFDFS